MWSICKKDLGLFFSNLSGFISVSIFLLITGLFLFVFPESSIFNSNFATLTPFFKLAPWVLLFLIPAISMRSFSDEFKNGTYETLSTQPLTGMQIVLGKYFFILISALIVLLPTVTYVFSIKQLSTTGVIDNGGILGSYLGLIFLSAVYASIGLCCSAFTNNAVVAFLLGVFISLAIYFGFHALSTIPAFEGGIDYYIDFLGIDAHYESISRGVIDTRDLFYFLSLITLCLFVTHQRIQRKLA
jgi:ABC-2 type transport system permease protein